ncbi:NAD(P)H-hydrate dehydratase [Vagococcus sp. BWB3-3]|uniref:ADP-dependent (S)-NAD(P)H-hydrate dehydratase n=1 Tax=Vagococcus allomyrinae TaxID=2794353 RepID=A0A940P3M6_9ENTE|nr:NAD(P)H-hydrate dehydratase [Vagococcus allomyrinae]
MEIISEEILGQTIRAREPMSHKGNYGRVCLIGGDQHYGGAIILASQAAVHSGAGLVTTATMKVNHGPLHARLPEAMVVDWSESDRLTTSIQQATVILIGPGLGLATDSLTLLKRTLMLLTKGQICLIDGSAITLIADYRLTLPDGPTYIFTPHEKEWERLSGLLIENQDRESNRLSVNQLKGIVVLKKHRTEVYLADGIWQNPLGTAAMATGGMGDTLAGMIAGFVAQFPLNNAILAAVYLHSYIGERLGKAHYVVLPSELITHISSLMKRFEGN